MTHQFKIYPEYFRAVVERRKSFEVRKKRHLEPYLVGGDCVILYEFDPDSEMYTGRVWNGKITYVLDDERFCKEDYVIFGIVEI